MANARSMVLEQKAKVASLLSPKNILLTGVNIVLVSILMFLTSSFSPDSIVPMNLSLVMISWAVSKECEECIDDKGLANLIISMTALVVICFFLRILKK